MRTLPATRRLIVYAMAHLKVTKPCGKKGKENFYLRSFVMTATQFFPGIIFGVSLLFCQGAQAIESTPAGANIAVQVAAASEPKSELIKRGEYVARLGDCVACHTAPNGKLMSGGLELKTPFGSIYSTNITPDAQTGIGKYSFEQFDRAMRKGIAAEGRNRTANHTAAVSGAPKPARAR